MKDTEIGLRYWGKIFRNKFNLLPVIEISTLPCRTPKTWSIFFCFGFLFFELVIVIEKMTKYNYEKYLTKND